MNIMNKKLQNSKAFEVNDLPEEIRSLVGSSRALIIPLGDDKKQIEDERASLKDIIAEYYDDNSNFVKTLNMIGEHLRLIEEILKNGGTVKLDNLITLDILFDFAMLEANLVTDGKVLDSVSTTALNIYYGSDLVDFYLDNAHKYVKSICNRDDTNLFADDVAFKDGEYVIINRCNGNSDVLLNLANGIAKYIDTCKVLGGLIWFKPIDDCLNYIAHNISLERNSYNIARYGLAGEFLIDVYRNNKEVYLDSSVTEYVGVVIDGNKLVDNFDKLYK